VAGAHLGEPIGGELVGSDPSQERLLALDHPVGGRWEVRSDFQRNPQYPVLIGVQQVIQGNDEASDLDRLADLIDPHVSVRNGGPGREEVKPCPARLVEVPHGAVGDATNAAKSTEDRRVDLTPQGPVCRRVIQVLDNHDSRRPDCPHVLVQRVVASAGPVRPRRTTATIVAVAA
jgi:hypothetical protein